MITTAKELETFLSSSFEFAECCEDYTSSTSLAINNTFEYISFVCTDKDWLDLFVDELGAFVSIDIQPEDDDTASRYEVEIEFMTPKTYKKKKENN